MPWPHLGPLRYRCHEMCQLQLNMPWQVQVQSPVELYGLWKAKIPPRRKRKFRVLIVQFWIFQRFVDFSWNLNYVCAPHMFSWSLNVFFYQKIFLFDLASYYLFWFFDKNPCITDQNKRQVFWKILRFRKFRIRENMWWTRYRIDEEADETDEGTLKNIDLLSAFNDLR